ncbi:TonB-dependent receptor plug domain-containing protein [Maricaulis sp. CAU 1757]
MLLKSLMAGTALALLTVPAGLAQTVALDGAVIQYAPDYFATYNPVTARDMVRQVPGFSIDNGARVRGLADTFANVLIDGEKQSTKSESIHDILGRIPAGSVARIDLVRQAVPGVDMRGQTRVVNVVLNETADRTTTLEVISEYAVASGSLTPAVVVSSSWDVGDTRITLGLRHGQHMVPMERREQLLDAQGQLIERRDERTSPHHMMTRFNGTLSQSFEDGSRVELTGSAGRSGGLMRDRSRIYAPDGALTGVDLFLADSEHYNWEGGLTYERPLSERLSAQIVGLSRGGTSEAERQFAQTAAGGDTRTTFFDQSVDSAEHAVRSWLTWDRSTAHSFELGGEVAYNARDNALAIRVQDGGSSQLTDLPVSDTMVEEVRGELFASHVWAARENVSVESGLRIERSRIEQSGDASRERSFTYAKPRLQVTWEASEQSQWQLVVERSVAQLDFGEFASAVDPRDNQVLIGNPELEPQKVWRGQLRWERRWGEGGSFAVTGVHERITDVQDLRPIRLSDGQGGVITRDAPGNIGDGRVSYLNVEASLPLDGLGLDNAKLDLFGMLRHSEVTDPTTGESRAIDDLEPWRLVVDFRHDMPERDLAWGLGLYWQGEESSWRFDREIHSRMAAPQINVFVESTVLEDTTLRVFWGDVFKASYERERVFYDGSRDVADVVRREHQEMQLGGFVAARLVRTF